MQQPITAPDVGNTSQPTAAIAANQASGVTVCLQPPACSGPKPAGADQPAQPISRRPVQ